MLRREFLSGSSLALGLAAAGASPQVTKSVVDYGARPDGKNLSTASIQRAIDDAAERGGGAVYFPAGTYLTGRIDLKSRITLYLDAGCTLLGSTSLDDYRGGPGSSDSSGRFLVYARDAEDVAIAGRGRIDGQGQSFWEPSGRAPLPAEDQWADVASHAYKPKQSGRPGPMIRFANCRRASVEGVRLQNSPSWTLHMLNCDDVRIAGLSIKNPIFGPNTDGIDLTGCQNVFVTGCSIETGDDAICLKSENPLGSEPRLVKNIVVSNCILNTCCNGFKLGTSSEAGFENIVFSDSVIFSDSDRYGDRVISGVALEVIDGGWIDGVLVSGIRMQRVRTPLFIRLGNRKRVHNYPQHGLRRVEIENVQASETILASSITGLAGDPVHDVRLSHLRFENVLASRPEWVGRPVPEKDSAYPEARMWGMLPVSGLYVRHATGLRLDNVLLSAASGEARPTIQLEDVDGARIAAMASAPVSGPMPVVSLVQTRNAWISGCEMPAGTSTFAGVQGNESANLLLTGNDLRAARQPVAVTSDVPAHAVALGGNITAMRTE